MAGMGYAVMGTATAKGEGRAVEAAQKAIASPLLEAGAIDGARGILINITGSASLKLAEVNEASSIIQSAAHEDANIIFGAVLDEKMKDEVKITVIATGFKERPARGQHALTAAAAISQARTASAYVPPSAPEPPPPSPPIHRAPPPAPLREHTSLDALKSGVKGNFEQDDLDVPAFIRKRAESH
jgi:cell division protein FtsZ